jgi:hypothetical protein
LNKDYDIIERFPRSAKAPDSAEVLNWPFPQFNAAAQKSEPSPDYGFSERFDRPEQAPTKPEVLGWPTA